MRQDNYLGRAGYRLGLWALIALVPTLACRRRTPPPAPVAQVLTTPGVPAGEMGRAQMTDQGLSQQVAQGIYPFLTPAAPDSFRARIRGTYTGPGHTLPLQLVLRGRRDAGIHMLALAPVVGTVLLEALIRPDSFMVINRLERTYMSGPIDLMASNLPFEADYATLYNLLSGGTDIGHHPTDRYLPVGDTALIVQSTQPTDYIQIRHRGDTVQSVLLVQESQPLAQWVNHRYIPAGEGRAILALDKDVTFFGEAPARETVFVSLRYTEFTMRERVTVPARLAAPQGYHTMVVVRE